MKLTPEAEKMFEMFFRQLLGEDNFRLPPVYFYAGRFSKFLTKSLKIHGITIGRNIFIEPALLSNDLRLLKINSELAAHEIAHVLQYGRDGFIRFLFKYLRDYRDNLKRKRKWDKFSRYEAYLEIPYEIEAREIAEQFIRWKKDYARKKEKQEAR